MNSHTCRNFTATSMQIDPCASSACVGSRVWAPKFEADGSWHAAAVARCNKKYKPHIGFQRLATVDFGRNFCLVNAAAPRSDWTAQLKQPDCKVLANVVSLELDGILHISFRSWLGISAAVGGHCSARALVLQGGIARTRGESSR